MFADNIGITSSWTFIEECSVKFITLKDSVNINELLVVNRILTVTNNNRWKTKLLRATNLKFRDEHHFELSFVVQPNQVYSMICVTGGTLDGLTDGLTYWLRLKSIGTRSFGHFKSTQFVCPRRYLIIRVSLSVRVGIGSETFFAIF